MKTSILTLSATVVLATLPAAAFAELSFNIGGVTDYRYRGISQTRLRPALQGGIDYSLDGFYVGTWASTIKWVKDSGGDSSEEIDLYGGYKGDIVKDSLSYDVGVLNYQYPGNKLRPITGANATTTELYGALTYGPATLKYSHALTNTFANPSSKNSYYVDLSATFDVAGIALVPHVGHQKIKGPVGGPASYTDYSMTVSKDFSGVVLSLAVVGTNADKNFYVPGPEGHSNRFLGRTAAVAGLKYNF